MDSWRRRPLQTSASSVESRARLPPPRLALNPAPPRSPPHPARSPAPLAPSGDPVIIRILIRRRPHLRFIRPITRQRDPFFRRHHLLRRRLPRSRRILDRMKRRRPLLRRQVMSMERKSPEPHELESAAGARRQSPARDHPKDVRQRCSPYLSRDFRCHPATQCRPPLSQSIDRRALAT